MNPKPTAIEAFAASGVPLRTVYTVAEFVTEILREKRSVKWVRSEIHRRRIRTVARRPYLIPQSEAVRFVCPE